MHHDRGFLPEGMEPTSTGSSFEFSRERALRTCGGSQGGALDPLRHLACFWVGGSSKTSHLLRFRGCYCNKPGGRSEEGEAHRPASVFHPSSQAPDRTAQHAYTVLLLPVASVILCFSLMLWRGLFAPRALAHLQLQALDGVIFMAMWAVFLHHSLSVWSYFICRLATEGSPFKGDLHLRRWTPRWGPGLLSLDPFRLISDNLSHQVSRRRIGQARQRRTRSSRLRAVCLLAMLVTGLGWKTHQTIDVATSRSSQSSLLLSRLFGAYHQCPFMSPRSLCASRCCPRAQAPP